MGAFDAELYQIGYRSRDKIKPLQSYNEKQPTYYVCWEVLAKEWSMAGRWIGTGKHFSEKNEAVTFFLSMMNDNPESHPTTWFDWDGKPEAKLCKCSRCSKAKFKEHVRMI